MPPPRPLTALVVCDWFTPSSVGGVEAAAWALAAAVAAAHPHHRVAVLTPSGPGGPGPGVRAVAVPGSRRLVRIYYAPRGAGLVSALSQAGAPTWAPPSPPGVLPLLRSVAAREGRRGAAAVVLHAHSSASPFALACLAAGRALGLACVLTEHSIAAGPSGGGWCAAAWTAAAAAAAPPTLTAVSSAAADDAAARLGRPPGSVTVLANAIDGAALAPAAAAAAARRACAAARAAAHRPPPPVRVLSVTRLTARKGAGDLGRALRLAAAADGGLAFTVVGGGPARPALEAGLGWRAGRGGAGRPSTTPPAPRSRTTLLGPTHPAHIPALLADHDVFLSASPTEAFGLAALEAGAAGLALVVRGVGGASQALAPLMQEGRVILVPLSTGGAGLAAGVAAAAAAVRRLRGAAALPPSRPPLASVLTAHCWHRAAAQAVRLYERAAAGEAAAGAFPPLPGRPVLAAARAALHALLRAWAALLDLLDPPRRTGAVTVVCACI